LFDRLIVVNFELLLLLHCRTAFSSNGTEIFVHMMSVSFELVSAVLQQNEVNVLFCFHV